MTKAKLIEDSLTLHRFVAIYCEHKHEVPKNSRCLHVSFQGEELEKIPYVLCEECENTFLYAYTRLQECPHVIKPNCRNCLSPCYESSMRKKVAKIMSYSGMRLGLTRLRKLFCK